MQDMVIYGVYRMGETALIVVSSRMTGTSLTSQEAVLKHLLPVHERKHLKPFERPGGDTPCLGRSSLCTWPWFLCVSVYSVSENSSTFVAEGE